MSLFILIVGFACMSAGAAVIFSGLHALLGCLTFRARWKWGDAHKLKRSVVLGWNTGAPPDGVWVLVRHYAEFRTRVESDLRDNELAVMRRRGDRCYSVGGGLEAPITNITGWLEIVEPALEQNDG